MPTGSSLTDEELRALAGRRVASGDLPVSITTNILAGAGDLRLCVLCGEGIAADHIEYTVVVPDKSNAAEQELCFHLRCHNAWQLECLARSPFKPAAQVASSEPEQPNSAGAARA